MASNANHSELEKTNLEVHVDMSRQRYANLSEKVETLDERLDAVFTEIGTFRKEHAESMAKLREETATNAQGTQKVFVGAAASVIAGLLGTIVVLLVAFI